MPNMCCNDLEILAGYQSSIEMCFTVSRGKGRGSTSYPLYSQLLLYIYASAAMHRSLYSPGSPFISHCMYRLFRD